ncbi:Na+/H+ antiporter family protein [Saccharicrinis aurantiacus]|uniref:Na+/H+ antiporter family protein n=1 Tax=Saccharicrinis aurantiacus TaxID=1849719 RepID=UPI002493BD45|nr:SLC13 family permease [Saccharicrinis aurantiacus]
MEILLNPVVVAVIVMIILCLARMNVILSLIIAALVGGAMANKSLEESINLLIQGMGDNAKTALSYLLLGAFAVAIEKTGAALLLARKVTQITKGKKGILLLGITSLACASQNLIPVHIAFIPIVIPPLLHLMNKMNLDRRAAATALTFGLKAPYIMIPVGFGLVFHNLIQEQMTANKLAIETNQIWKALFIPGLGMIVGLLFALFISYRKARIYKNILPNEEKEEELKFEKKHLFTLLAAIIAFVVQLITDSLVLGAIAALITMFATRAITWKVLNESVNGGIAMMGFVAIVMLVAAGFGNVIRETQGAGQLVEAIQSSIGHSKVIAATLMLVLGLFLTLGIGTSFGTVPILAALFCPLGESLGFSTMAIVALLGTAAALGDAGSPASDSTLGPTAGLNVDGQHDHIWDTCVPTFLHFNIPLIIFGVIAALVL